MLALVWISLGVAVVAPAAGAVVAGRAGWRGWKALSATSGRITYGLGRVAELGAAAADRAATSTERSQEIADAASRLERSLAELHVLRRAARRSVSGVHGVRAALPRK